MPRTQLYLLSSILGFVSVFVFIVGAEPFEVVGANSVREVVAGSIAVAVYLAVCQYLVARKVGSGFRGKLPALACMDVGLLFAFLIIAIPESRGVLVAQAIPMLLSGCVGSFAGAMIACRRSAQPGHGQIA